MSKKIGVFVCHCGTNIAKTVDVEAVTKYANSLDNVVISENYKYMCSDLGAQLIKKSIKKHNLDGVVIACCSPRMHEHTFRQVAEDGGLNQFTVEIANIREQCSWAHDNKQEATEKAKVLVRAAVAKTRMLESLTSSTVAVTPKALVIGGGIAGIQASLDLANAGYKISLVEQLNMGKRGAAYIPFPQAIPLKYVIDPEHCLFLTRGKCGTSPACQDACVPNAIDFNQKAEEIERNVGVIVVTTGYDLMDPASLYEYSYSNSPDVITTLELERFISSSGPTSGEILCPSNGEKPKSITFILCVGSRDETQHSWCCRIGCMSALKHVYLLWEKLGDEVEINICYNDVRSFGKGYEEFYRKIRGVNANFFRGRPSEVRPTKDHLKIDIFDTMTSKLFEMKTDMVVLVPALVPRADSDELSRILHISQSGDGFLLEAHPKLRPMDTFTDGIFIAGCCQGPKDIQDSVSQASGAASRALTILSKKELETEPLIAYVNEDVCSGCGICISVCSFNALELVKDEEGKTKSKVNEALCKGCGSCVGSCPSGAIQQYGFKDKQILPMLDETL